MEGTLNKKFEVAKYSELGQSGCGVHDWVKITRLDVDIYSVRYEGPQLVH